MLPQKIDKTEEQIPVEECPHWTANPCGCEYPELCWPIWSDRPFGFCDPFAPKCAQLRQVKEISNAPAENL